MQVLNVLWIVRTAGVFIMKPGSIGRSREPLRAASACTVSYITNPFITKLFVNDGSVTVAPVSAYTLRCFDYGFLFCDSRNPFLETTEHYERIEATPNVSKHACMGAMHA